jgi:L-rhamnose mutarotase
VGIILQRVCFVLRLRPDKIGEYREAHTPVWPEMVEALQHAGWHNYSLFLTPDGTLIGYVETDNWAEAWSKIQEAPINIEWQRYMAHCFEDLPEGVPDKSIVPLPEVFHLD